MEGATEGEGKWPESDGPSSTENLKKKLHRQQVCINTKVSNTIYMLETIRIGLRTYPGEMLEISPRLDLELVGVVRFPLSESHAGN